MKKVLLLISLLVYSILTKATDQVPDILFYQNQKLTLNTGWAYPSPLQTFFAQNNLKYPFGVISTANYRGHIATWEIENDKLFLREIWINDSLYKPGYFSIKSKSDTTINGDKVFADWFSGILTCQSKNTYIFHIKNGSVLNTQTLTDNDFRNYKRYL